MKRSTLTEIQWDDDAPLGKYKLEDLQHQFNAILQLGHGVVKVHVGPLGSTSPLPPPYGDRTFLSLAQTPAVATRSQVAEIKQSETVQRCLRGLNVPPKPTVSLSSCRESDVPPSDQRQDGPPHRHQMPDAQGVMSISAWRSCTPVMVVSRRSLSAYISRSRSSSKRNQFPVNYIAPLLPFRSIVRTWLTT